MRCRSCSSTNTRVTSTDHYPKYTKRYCRCLDCGTKYITVERYEVTKPGPVKGTPKPGKVARGSQHGSSIFTETDIKTIRDKYAKGLTLKILAEQYGISSSYVSRIVNRKAWSHLT